MSRRLARAVRPGCASPKSRPSWCAANTPSRSMRPRSLDATCGRLSQELDYNLLFSQQGHLTLAHTDRAVNVMVERAAVNRLLGVDSRVIDPREIHELCPELDLSAHPAYPIQAALYHPPGAVIRHD